MNETMDFSTVAIGALKPKPVPDVVLRKTNDSTLISDEYRALNAELHHRRPDYGANGHKWAGQIVDLVKMVKAKTILDYGCGKQTLGGALPHLLIAGYDPAIPGLDDTPEPADLVICTDVLEHIEPERLDAVLDDLKRCAGIAIFMSIATRPAVKFLADGRNAHLTVKPCRWWLPKIMDRWELVLLQTIGTEFAVLATRLEPQS